MTVTFKDKEFSGILEKARDYDLEYKEAIKEAQNLSKYLKKKDKLKLVEALEDNYIYPFDPSHCIYGTIFKDCNSTEADKAIKECATLFIVEKNFEDNFKERIATKPDFRSSFILTALESYIWYDRSHDVDEQKVKEIVDIISESK